MPISQPSTTPIPIPIPVPMSSQTPATIPIPIPSNPQHFPIYPNYPYVASTPQAHLLSPIARRTSEQKSSLFLTVPPQTISPQKIPQTIPPPLTVPPISAQIVSQQPNKPINATISTPPAPHQNNQTPSPPQPLINSACLAQPVTAISPSGVYQANIMNLEEQAGGRNSSPTGNVQNASGWSEEGQGMEMKSSGSLQNIELQKQILMENQQNGLQGLGSAQERSFKRERDEEEEQEFEHRAHKEFQQYPEPIEQEKPNMSLIQ
uniref:Uncharacterized protein n=1 Tax=Arcella intermedia TaxID=1963864 RepID=A0A6B2LDX9_9EUKA